MKIKLLTLLAGLLTASTMKAYKLTAYIPQENPTETGDDRLSRRQLLLA